MSRRVAIVARLVALVFALAALWFGWTALFEADALNAHARNPRLIARGVTVRRGDILSADGRRLAYSQRKGKVYERVYPEGDDTAHIVGYYSQKYGATGLERALNDTLVGRQGFATYREWLDETMGRRRVGNDVVLTLDTRVQRAALDALAGEKGAIVVLDPRTGAVLALAAVPTFDPSGIDERFEALSKDPGAPLVDRAIQGRYPPGSTYKIVTATGALATGVTSISTSWSGPGTMKLGGGKVTNYESAGYGSIAFQDAFAKSVNTVFAQIGVKMGAQAFVDRSRRFGMTQAPPFELKVRASTLPDPDVMDTWELAWAAVGQPVRPRTPGGPLVTPLQMALVGAGIANRGVIMRPTLVGQVRDPRGLVVTTLAARRWTVAADPRTANTVRDLMVRTVEQGTGGRAAIEGVKVAGKTGTAETGKDPATGEDLEPHAWFVGFAPADDPKVVVAVVVENAGVGGRVAAPKAREVIEAALEVVK